MNYFQQNNISITRGKEWLLEFLYPNYTIAINNLPPFLASDKVIFISSKRVPPRPDIDLIQIGYSSPKKLDDRKIFLEFLEYSGRKMKDSVKQTLLLLDEDEFWEQAKLIWIIGKSSYDLITEEGSVYKLFLIMFSDYEEAYDIYRKTGLPYKVVFSSLLTMMLKSQQTENLVCSPGYKAALIKNSMFIQPYRKAVLNYIESIQSEVDFMQFLFECSPVGRK